LRRSRDTSDRFVRIAPGSAAAPPPARWGSRRTACPTQGDNTAPAPRSWRLPHHLPDRIRRPLHPALVNSREVLADHAQGKELRAGEDRNDRREKRKSLHRRALNQVSGHHENKNPRAKQRESEPREARQSE